MTHKININKIIKYSIFVIILLFSFNGKTLAQGNHKERVCIYKADVSKYYYGAFKSKEYSLDPTETILIKVAAADQSSLKLTFNIIGTKQTIDNKEIKVRYHSDISTEEIWRNAGDSDCPSNLYYEIRSASSNKLTLDVNLSGKECASLPCTPDKWANSSPAPVVSAYKSLGNKTCNLSTTNAADLTPLDLQILEASINNKTTLTSLSIYADKAKLTSSAESGGTAAYLTAATTYTNNVLNTLNSEDLIPGNNSKYTLSTTSSCGSTIIDLVSQANANIQAANKQAHDDKKIDDNSYKEINQTTGEIKNKASEMLTALDKKLGIIIKNETKCGDIFTKGLMDLINKILNYVRIIVPIIIVLLGSMDFAKAVVANDKDALKKSAMQFLKRCIAIVVIFFIPLIVKLLMTKINDLAGSQTCINEIQGTSTNNTTEGK